MGAITTSELPPVRFDVAKAIEDVWLQPRLRRWPTSALIHQPPLFASQFSGYQPASFLELFFVVTTLRHRQWNAVCRIDQVRCLAPALRNLR